MKPEVATELINILYELDWEREADKGQLKNRFEDLITDLFERESVKQAISKIPDSWPQPVIKLFAILVDNIAPEDVNLIISTDSEGVAIRFNEDQVLRLEKTE